jgi:tetratricopeptide (TPR) repeat protein
MLTRTAKYRCLTFALSLVVIASAGCSQQEATKDQILARANDYFAAEEYAKAEKEYREALRLSPDNPVVSRQLGIIYFGQGQILQAYPLLNKSAELQPDDVDVQIKLGEILASQGERARARDAALRVLEKEPGHELALTLLASNVAGPEDVEDTRKVIENLRAKDRDRASYHLASGMLDLRKKDETRAESEFKAALDLDPKSSGAYLLLGSLYWSRNDLKAAEQAFSTAADLSPLRSPTRLRYAEFKLQTGALAEAKASFEAINRKAPDFLPARVALMKIVCKEAQNDDCFARVQDILAQDPTNFDALFQDGFRSIRTGDAAKAMRIFGFLSNTYPRNPQVRYQLALANLLYAKDAGLERSREAAANAESSLDIATKLDPGFEPATLLLAELKIKKGSPAAAVDLLARLIKEKPQTARAYNLLAIAYSSLQQWDQALAVYRQITELFPKDPEPAFLAGSLLLAQSRLPDARKELETSVKISPDYLPAVERLTDLDIAEKQYGTATERVQRLIDKDPKLAQPWGLRAKIYIAQGEFSRAEADLLKAIELDPKLEAAYVVLAQIYLATNRPDQAIAKLNTYLENDKSVPALMQLAMIHGQLKNFSAASEVYEKLLKIDPNYGAALNNLAVIYSEHILQLDKAYDLAKKATELGPNEPLFADTLGWTLFKKGDFANALRPLQQSAGKLPDNPNVQFHVGMAHYMLGQEEPSRLALQKAADASSNFSDKDEARGRLAVLAIKVGVDNSAARTALENYLQKWPNDPVARTKLGDVQQRDGAEDQAIKTFEKVLADYPLFAPAMRQLALLYGRRLTVDPKALELATKARQAYPDDPQTADALGWILFNKGEYSNALPLLQNSADKLPDQPQPQFHLGMAHYMLGEEAPARLALQKAAAARVDFPGRDEARRRVAVLAIQGGAASADARSELENYLRERPSDPVALSRLAELQQRDGAVDQAIKTYEKVVTDYPLFASAVRQLALLHGQRSPDDPKALEWATKARQAYPEDPEIAKTLGILNYRRGYYPRSTELLKEAATKGGDDPELLYYLGEAYYQLKQRNECKEALQHALTLKLSPKLADEAKRTLADCSMASPQ